MPSRLIVTLRAASVLVAVVTSLVDAQDTATRQPPTDAPRASRVGWLPVLGSAPETGLQYGATVYQIARPRGDTTTRESMTQLYAIYTVKQQLKVFLETDRWSRGNAWHMNARLEFLRFPLPYFGIGPGAPKDAEEWYTPRTLSLTAQIQRRLVPRVYAGVSYVLTKTSILEFDDAGVLQDHALPGTEGGRVGLLEGQAIWDSRDSHLATSRGSYLRMTGGLARGATGSAFDFERVIADARQFVALGRTVVAAHVVVEGTTGEAPFDQLAQFGDANTMRGYERGRYRDRWMLAAQTEVRQPITAGGRLGAVLFGGAGTVAARAGSLGSAWQPTVGGGLRWRLFARGRTAIRVDYGVGRGSSGLYVALNDAF